MKQSSYRAVAALALIVVARIVLQFMLYAHGFAALTADDFGRVVIAELWRRNPYAIWQGPWLPFHTYLVGSSLALWHDLLLTPRLLVFVFGAASLGFMYKLTEALFIDRRVALISVVLLAVNPAHMWLSSAPLTEIMQSAFILGFLWANVQLLDQHKVRYLYMSAVILGIANTIRFEAWIFTAFFSIQLLFLAAQRAERFTIKPGHTLAAWMIVWLFPAAWLAGNYVQTGDALNFLTINRAFDSKWYGDYQSYANYLYALLDIDRFATILYIPAIITCLVGFWHKRSVRTTTLYVVGTIFVFALLQRGQVQPHGNYIRYLSLFVFIAYPLIAGMFGLIGQRWRVPIVAKTAAITLLVVAVAAWQVRSAFQYINDPAVEGLRIGQQLRQLRAQDPDTATQPLLIELNYWQYLGLHVGANDLSTIVYDRRLNMNKLNDSTSLLLEDPQLLSACIQAYHFRYIAVRAESLRQMVQEYLHSGPISEDQGYAIYMVDDTFAVQQTAAQSVCPLKIGTGY